jgi:hypothetical protein
MFYDGLGDEELMTVQGLDSYGDYGALYQAPDGSLYQMQGFSDMPDGSVSPVQGFDDALGGPGDGVPGEVRQGPDGRLYQWVEGYDGLGDPVGFWSLIPAVAKTVLPVVASRILPKLLSAGGRGAAGQVLRRILPQASRFVQQIAPTMPVVPPIPVVQAPPVVQPMPVQPMQVQPMPVQPMPEQPMPAAPDAGDELTGYGEFYQVPDDLTGLGALYQAPDGSLYQVQGAVDDERLAEDELIRGLDEDERYGEDEDLRDTEGYARGDGEGGCCCPGIRGVDAFVPAEPPRTPACVRPAMARIWPPLW